MVAPSIDGETAPQGRGGGLVSVSETDFAQVYEDYFAFVWRSLRALGVGESALDDATQDVFVVVHRRLSDFEGRSSLQTWLFGIACRVAANSRRNLQRTSHDELSNELVSTDPDPQRRAQQGEAARFVQAFLSTLNEAGRTAFTACVLEQMTVPEAAEALGVNVNTMYTRVRAVRAQFAAALEAAEREHDEL